MGDILKTHGFPHIRLVKYTKMGDLQRFHINPDLIQSVPVQDEENFAIENRLSETKTNNNETETVRKVNETKLQINDNTQKNLPVEQPRNKTNKGICRSHQGFSFCGHFLYLVFFVLSLVLICVLMYFLVSISLKKLNKIISI